VPILRFPSFVGGLEIATQDALMVRRSQPCAQLARKLEGLGWRQPVRWSRMVRLAEAPRSAGRHQRAAPATAVATGGRDVTALKRAGADVVFEDLRDALGFLVAIDLAGVDGALDVARESI
jgi:hypothetical protein